ncbi:hypothetical protein HanRHA438_Chr12g0571351 [Helianthus annuus]|uniref:Uncharacterized protein n=1 Tax=Helianthus annuus TaxID=4232 RepID=A0A9K3HJI7_HELAN|nr:hypothetical protein HanXRQr2_Chr14g0634281 [Helianthus annuus]KAF5779491.1 hypothetical protein HanXRQr2_Chr12g0560101 [Helianthus annuus]KAJ0490742.1 hypothetical protein HanHA300_Chr12g0459071 [Helianthus annuus]KAJ0495055.1 hypothetical protein HanIR_Chr12g0604591 [Helianthus annuus]KAJ0506664.1 hypothetical protein HanHA89_Chr12g0484681 [Helianthus annuus]
MMWQSDLGGKSILLSTFTILKQMHAGSEWIWVDQMIQMDSLYPSFILFISIVTFKTLTPLLIIFSKSKNLLQQIDKCQLGFFTRLGFFHINWIHMRYCDASTFHIIFIFFWYHPIRVFQIPKLNKAKLLMFHRLIVLKSILWF